jgi:hypothetical protein
MTVFDIGFAIAFAIVFDIDSSTSAGAKRNVHVRFQSRLIIDTLTAYDRAICASVSPWPRRARASDL